jgi:formate hydrogenlyase subunit 4
MVLFTASLISGSTSLPTIVDTLAHRELAIYPSLAFAGVAFTMVSLAENARIPIDNPATHLELTMVHEAMILEYSGRHLALIELSASLKLLVYLSLIACIFLPWGMAPAHDAWNYFTLGAAGYIAKLAVGCIALAVFETAIAKMRVFRVPAFLGAALMLGLLGSLFLFVSRGF